MSDMKKKEEKN